MRGGSRSASRELIRFGVAFDRDDGGPGAGARGRALTPARPARRRRRHRRRHRGRAGRAPCGDTAVDDPGAHASLTDLLVRRTAAAVGARGVAGDGDGAERLQRRRGRPGHRRRRAALPHTTNPASPPATASPLPGAPARGSADLEFYQFHPTALAAPGNFLVSEAVRGEGAVLRDAAGERFMLDVHPDAELAPRDIVARGIAIEMAAQGGEPVLLDATALGARASSPSASRRSTPRAARPGFDWARGPVPVTPAAHYWMGGVAHRRWGRTSLPGLFAVGEVACTGVHGANRLASNSLLEAWCSRTGRQWRCAPARRWTREATTVASRRLGAPMLRPEFPRPAPGPPSSRAALQQLMWDAAGIHRIRAGPRPPPRARSQQWRAAETGPATRAEREDANLLQLARLLRRAPRWNADESRGAHFRSDFPTVSDDSSPTISIARPAEVPVPC